MTSRLASRSLLGVALAAACADPVGPPPPSDTAVYDLVYESTDSPTSTQSQLFRLRAGEPTRSPVLGAATFAISPDVSLDGRRLVYQAPLPLAGDFGIFIANADGTNARLLVSSTSADLSAPALSPDGSRVAFVKHFSPERSEIWVIGADGSGERRITLSPEGGTLLHGYPAWSPDGQRLAFSMGQPGNLHLAITLVAGGAIAPLTQTTVSDVEPSWSPDGTRIVFARTATPAQSDLRVVTIATGLDVVLITGMNARMPAWSPRDDVIAFSGRDLGETSDIFTVAVDSRAAVHVTQSDTYERHPSWAKRNP
jgi:Tol biopolymer transport system component